MLQVLGYTAIFNSYSSRVPTAPANGGGVPGGEKQRKTETGGKGTLKYPVKEG